MSKYSSGLVSESFWFLEVKLIIKMLNQGKTWGDIKKEVLENNLLGIAKEYRAKRVYGYLKNRIMTLDEKTLEIFEISDLQTQKTINLIAIAKQNALFFEFIYEVYREKVMFKEKELTASDINIFFKNKQMQHEEIYSWTEVTLKRLRSTYFNFLTDAGLLTMNGKVYLITPSILDIVLERSLIDNGNESLARAIKGVD